VEEKFSKEQKRYFLMEQLKHIQKELGITKDEKGAVIQKFVDRFDPVKCAILAHPSSSKADTTAKPPFAACQLVLCSRSMCPRVSACQGAVLSNVGVGAESSL
jgi:hypothetical protein